MHPLLISLSTLIHLVMYQGYSVYVGNTQYKDVRQEYQLLYTLCDPAFNSATCTVEKTQKRIYIR